MRVKWKVRNGDGAVIGQYQQHRKPEHPDGWDGEWIVEETNELNDEPVNWWFNSETQ